LCCSVRTHEGPHIVISHHLLDQPLADVPIRARDDDSILHTIRTVL